MRTHATWFNNDHGTASPTASWMSFWNASLSACHNRHVGILFLCVVQKADLYCICMQSRKLTNMLIGKSSLGNERRCDRNVTERRYSASGKSDVARREIIKKMSCIHSSRPAVHYRCALQSCCFHQVLNPVSVSTLY